MLQIKRVIAFIDGFNLYHSIDDLKEPSLKWLDLVKLINSVLNTRHSLVKVIYFTALLKNEAKKSRHKIYIKALEKVGVEVIYGRFSFTQKRTNNNQIVTILEEKETDVNIAIHMIKMAFEDKYDEAFLVSGDSDQVPTINMIRKSFGKDVRLILPPNSKADELKMVSTFYQTLTQKLLKDCLLPSRIILDNGEELRKPDNWA